MEQDVERDMLEDLHMLSDMHQHAHTAAREYLEDPDNPPHLPNSLYGHGKMITNAILKVHANRRYSNEETYELTVDMIVMVLLTGMKVGEAGIKLGDLTSCDCHKVNSDEVTMEAFQAMMDDLRKDDM